MGMQTVTGIVTKLVSETKKRQKFNLKTPELSIQVFIEDSELRVSKGEHIQLTGGFERDYQYREWFNAKDVTYRPLSNDLLREFLMSGSGIGPAIADQLLENFPDNLVDILQTKNIKMLQQASNVTRALAIVLTNLWHEKEGKANLIAFIEGVLKETTEKNKRSVIMSAKKTFDFYGEKTVDKLTDDPYRVWAFGTFKSAEIFAAAMGVQPDDERRLICAVEESLYRKLKQHHTQVYPLEFQKELEEVVGSGLSMKAIIAANNVANTAQPRLIVKHNPTINPSAHSFPPVTTNEAEALYNQTYALPGVARMESYVQAQLLLRINQHVENIDVADSVILNYRLPRGDALNSDQQLAVKTVLTNAVTCISGGAGTGKTSILYAVNSIIKSVAQRRLDKEVVLPPWEACKVKNKKNRNKKKKYILQVALAGKAALRLTQQTSDEAMTIAALLKEIESDEEFLDGFEAPVFHIDEASMVDLTTMYRVLEAFENRPIRLVFIGDWAQLAPPSFGLVFHKLIKSDNVASVELKINYRNDSGIVEVAEKIKKGLFFESNNEVEVIEYDNDESVMDIVQQRYADESALGEVFTIAALNDTVNKCNINIHKMLRQHDKVITGAEYLRVNDLVIYKRNNKYLKLVNGSTGVVTGSGTVLDKKGQEIRGLFVEFGEGERFLKTTDTRDWTTGAYNLQHAYAMTCHSAQGSEFDTIIVVLEKNRYTERSWLYTAITRAKKKVIIIAEKGEIQNALNRGFAFEHINSGLDL
jgi:exodeoxyribonuclease V alpha subunit